MKRESKNLASCLEHRLNSYALAASAAGVGLMTLTPVSEARIVYTPAHHTLKTGDVFHLDLNHDRISDFLISNYSFCTADVCGRTLRVLPAASRNHVGGAKGIGGPFYAYALKRGVKIGPRQPFSGKLMVASGTEYGTVGQWLNVSDRYLGLKFVIHGRTHFGWARLSVIVGGGTITGALTGYAYETIPNKSIIAGRTKGPDVVTVQPATLGHLARGASAIPAWRQKESAGATQ